MKAPTKQFGYRALLLVLLLGATYESTNAQRLGPDANSVVGDGWHPWYEIKADLEDPHNLIICGTKWDALRNASFGFVYASSDSGKTWSAVLEDRSTTWVTEHSCAFGPNHMAYFISEAANVIDGHADAGLGITRLYVSTDGGIHWEERCKTGWADYSSSAVSPVTRRLYTFFNGITNEPGRNWGSNVGLLIFSADGTNVAGPFYDTTIPRLGYLGIYPSSAVALNSGVIAALYYGMKPGQLGEGGDLGIIRADQSPEPSLEHTTVFHTVLGKDCLNFGQGALAYDAAHDRLFVAYVGGCEETRIILTSSSDDGRTWAKDITVADSLEPARKISHPSLVVASGGGLGLLWEEGLSSGRWLFSYIRNEQLVEPPIELSGLTNTGMSNDSLWTYVYEPNGPQGRNPGTPSESSITVNVRMGPDNVWRANALAETNNKIVAVWPSQGLAGMQLNSGVIDPSGSPSKQKDPGESVPSHSIDVTRQTVIQYGGPQHYDSPTETLRVCLTLGNRGDTPIRTPIKLEVRDVRSPRGTASILGSTNGLTGPGAVLDVSGSVTGDRIPPGATTNPFCLSSHLEIERNKSATGEDDLLSISMRVFASTDSTPEPKEQAK